MPLHDDAKLLEVCAALRAEHAAFFGVGLKNTDPGPLQRGTADDVAALPGVWLDLDTQSPNGAHASADLPTDEQAVALLDAFPLEPTAVVHSGWGLQIYWLFDELRTCSTEAARTQLKQLVDAVQDCFQREGQARGFHVDKTADLSRVLRLPGTRNNKVPGNTKEVTLLISDGPRYSLETIAGAAGVGSVGVKSSVEDKRSTPEVATPEPVLVASSTDVSTPAPPTPSPAVSEDPLIIPALTIDELKNKLRESTRQTVRALLLGLPFAEPGKRDITLAGLCQTIMNLTPGTANLAPIVELFSPSLAAMKAEFDHPDNPALTEADVLRKLETAQTKKLKEMERDHVATKELRAAQKARRAAEALIEPYTEEELNAFAAKLGVSRVELQHRWVIQRGPAFYVLVEGTYRKPISERELAQSLPRDLARAPIEWYKYTKDGGEVKRKISDILPEITTVARDLAITWILPESRYDAETETFHEVAAQVVPRTPTFHPEIDKWLHLLAGSETNKLFDWLATVTWLSRQTCAIYLKGPKSAGKTLLAYACASVWGKSPTDFAAAVGGAFNGGLLECPIVLADENIPRTYRTQISSGEFRMFLGNNSVTIRRKFLADARLDGVPRLILAANNDNLLRFDDEMGPDDLAAVGERFLYIDVPVEASQYLEELGGRKTTDVWVQEGKLAEHLLWLRDNRQVEPGSRFLVSGHATGFHNQLPTRATIPGLICEWLIGCAILPRPHILKDPLVLIGNGRYLVNTHAVAKWWDDYVASHAQPSKAMIGRLLKTLANFEERVNGLRYHVINVPMLCDFAKGNQLAEPEAIWARVNATVIFPPELMPAASVEKLEGGSDGN